MEFGPKYKIYRIKISPDHNAGYWARLFVDGRILFIEGKTFCDLEMNLIDNIAKTFSICKSKIKVDKTDQNQYPFNCVLVAN